MEMLWAQKSDGVLQKGRDSWLPWPMRYVPCVCDVICILLTHSLPMFVRMRVCVRVSVRVTTSSPEFLSHCLCVCVCIKKAWGVLGVMWRWVQVTVGHCACHYMSVCPRRKGLSWLDFASNPPAGQMSELHFLLSSFPNRLTKFKVRCIWWRTFF